MNRLPRCARLIIALPAVAIMIAGCANSRTTATNDTANAQASSDATPSRPPPVNPAGYGMSGAGYTTDVVTALRDSLRDDRATPAPVAVVAAGPVQPGQPAPTAVPVPQGQATAAAGPVPQQPAEPSYIAAYGVPSNGNTTDLVTELFGPRKSQQPQQ